MSEERLPCRSEECENTIQPATAKRNEGYCGPCYGRIKDEERQEYIRKNRKDVNPYENLNDPVEILLAFYKSKTQAQDPLVNLLPPPKTPRQLYSELTEDQVTRIMQVAIENLESEDTDMADNICDPLGSFTDHDLTPLQESLIKHSHFWSPIAFRNANDDIAFKLWTLIQKPNDDRNTILACLAWIGSPAVVAYLLSTEKKYEGLSTKPSDSTHEAGWEIRDFKRHNLYYDQCYSIESISGLTEQETAVKLVEPCEGECPSCRRQLVDFFQFDLTDLRFSFLPVPANSLHILQCVDCASYMGDERQAKLDSQGHGHWPNPSEQTEPISYGEGETVEWRIPSFTLVPRHPRHGVLETSELSHSQIGGIPTWIQGPNYPTCNCCGKTMMFVAQLDSEEVTDFEGIYYAFLCPDCQITATTYQCS